MHRLISCVHLIVLLSSPYICVVQSAQSSSSSPGVLASSYLQATLDPTVPSCTLTFVGYTVSQWYGAIALQWLEERTPSGDVVIRLGFPTDGVISNYTSTCATGVVQNLAMLHVFSNNASVVTLGQYFENATSIIYPPGTIDLVPQSFKLSFNISSWPFQSMENILALGFKAATSVSVFEMGGAEYPNGQLRSAEIEGMFDWVRFDLFNFAISQAPDGSAIYPSIGMEVHKSNAFPPSADAEIDFPAFYSWSMYDPTIQLVVAAPDRPQLLILILGISAAVLFCLAFGGLIAWGCRYYNKMFSDMNATDTVSINTDESTSLLSKKSSS